MGFAAGVERCDGHAARGAVSWLAVAGSARAAGGVGDDAEMEETDLGAMDRQLDCAGVGSCAGGGGEHVGQKLGGGRTVYFRAAAGRKSGGFICGYRSHL